MEETERVREPEQPSSGAVADAEAGRTEVAPGEAANADVLLCPACGGDDVRNPTRKILIAALLTPLAIYGFWDRFIPLSLILCFVLLDLLIALQTKKCNARCGSCGHRWTLPAPYASLRQARAR